MSGLLAGRRGSAARYLAFEHTAPEKNEFVDGKVNRRPRVGLAHVIIAGNLCVCVYTNRNDKSAQPLGSLMRICFTPGKRYGYVDLSVVVKPFEYDSRDMHQETLTNPILLAEITCRQDDNHEIALHPYEVCRDIPSLREHVLISEIYPRVEVFTRNEDSSWTQVIVEGLDSVARLESVGVDLPLAEIYAGVELVGSVKPLAEA